MYARYRIAVVVPAYNEADKIERTLRSVPAFVDHVIVIDDASVDATAALEKAFARAGLEVISHPKNRGVGAALATGYRRAYELGADVTAVMAGDAQMDPQDLPALVQAVVDGADYAKGNRFATAGVWRVMPLSRYLGNVALSYFTRVCSGLWHVFDSQCGYTAVSRAGLVALISQPLFPRYGYPNDVLVRMACSGARVVDVPVRAVYGPAWRSGIRPFRVAWPITRLLLRGGLNRWWRRRIPAAHAPALLSD